MTIHQIFSEDSATHSNPSFSIFAGNKSYSIIRLLGVHYRCDNGIKPVFFIGFIFSNETIKSLKRSAKILAVKTLFPPLDTIKSGFSMIRTGVLKFVILNNVLSVHLNRMISKKYRKKKGRKKPLRSFFPQRYPL